MSTKQPLNKADLLRIWARFAFFGTSSFSKENGQGNKWTYAMSILAQKFYGDDESAKKVLLMRHIDFYQDEPQTGQVVAGYITRLEEEIAMGKSDDVEAIKQMKETLMEPVAGIGGTLVQKLIIPLLLILGIGLSTDGNWLGAVIYAVLALLIGLGISCGSFILGYKYGENAVNFILSDKIKRLTTGLSMFLLFMVGTLAIIFTNIDPDLPRLGLFEFEMTDWLIRVLGPLAVVYLAYYLMVEKKIKQEYIIIILSTIVVIGAVVMSFIIPVYPY